MTGLLGQGPGFLGSGVGAGEVVILFAVVLVLFGPRRLPDAARQMGRIVSVLRRAADSFRNEVLGIEIDEITRDPEGMPGKLERDESDDRTPRDTGTKPPAG